MCDRDPILGTCITPLELIKPTPISDPYLALLHSIIGQQLSVKAAATIQSRVFALFPDQYPSSDILLRKRAQTLHKSGLSRAKVKAVKGAAMAHRDGRLELDSMKSKTNDELISDLTTLWGVGPWTVDMLLMFSLNRTDVFPVLDVGIQNAMKRMYGLDLGGKELHLAMIEIAEPWRPYRSVACRYLWKWLHVCPA